MILMYHIYPSFPLHCILFCLSKEIASYPDVIKTYYLINFHVFLFIFKSVAHKEYKFGVV